MFEELRDINFELKRVNGGSFKIKIPKDLIDYSEEMIKKDEEKSSDLIEEQKSQYNSDDARKDLFEFQIENEIQDMVKRYLVKINLIKELSEMDKLDPKLIQYQIIQYVFT